MQDSLAGVLCDHGVMPASELLGQQPESNHLFGSGAWSSRRLDVDGVQLSACAPGCDAGPATQQDVTLGASGECDDDAFTRGPCVGDVVVLAVALESLVHAVGQPEQCEFPQGREVADPEVAGEGSVDLVGGVDVAVGHPPPERFGCHVDQLDLVGGPDDVVGDRVSLGEAGDLLDNVGQRLEVLDVERADHVQPAVQQCDDVLPSVWVSRRGWVGPGEVVDQNDLRCALEYGVNVEHAPRRRQPLNSCEEVLDRWSSVGLDGGRDDACPALGPAPRLAQHRVGLAHPGSGAQVEAETTAPSLLGHDTHCRCTGTRRGQVSRRISCRGLDAVRLFVGHLETHDEQAMDNAQLVLGAALMVLGAAVFIVGVFRAMDHRWTFGVHELWLIPLSAIALMLIGSFLIS